MAVQTSISVAPADGLKGQMATTEGASYTSKLATEAIVPGDFVFLASETTCSLPNAATDIPPGLGFAVLDPYRTDPNYADGESVRICNTGEIFVDVTVAAAVAGGPVYVIHATGKVRGTADASATLLPNAVFLTAGTGVQKVQLNGPFTVA